MHPRRASTNHNPVQVVLVYGILNQILPHFGAEITVFISMHHTGEVAGGINSPGNIHGAGDISTTVANKNSGSWHSPEPPLLVIFTESADQSLLGQLSELLRG